MFLADVVAVHADEKYMDENHKFHLEQAEPIMYSHGSYFGCGELLGTFVQCPEKKELDVWHQVGYHKHKYLFTTKK